MRVKGIILAVLMFFGIESYAELSQVKKGMHLASKYSETIENYYGTPLGKLEQKTKNELRASYLSCNASDKELLYQLEACTEVVRRIKEWRLKCTKGILHKNGNEISKSAFLERAQHYETLHKQVSQSPEYQAHKLAHQEYKEMVLNWLKQGHKPSEINLTLQDYGITNTRVLSRTEYWQIKDLEN